MDVDARPLEGVEPRRHPARVHQVAVSTHEDRLGLDDVILPARTDPHRSGVNQTRGRPDRRHDSILVSKTMEPPGTQGDSRPLGNVSDV
jgi:hypothetical protein